MSPTEVLARLEGATGPDRTLDSQVWCAAHGYEWRQDRAVSDPAVTASLDQALALVEQVLPGANCIGFDKSPRHVEAYVSRNNVSEGHWLVEASAPTPALALLAAMLRALIAQEVSVILAQQKGE